MPSTYSPSLKIELIGNGEQAGTWGMTTNNNMGSLIEQAITGYQAIPISGNYVLTNYNGLIDESRNAVLQFTGNLSASANVIAPSVQKTYIVINNAGANVTIKTSGGNGITLLNNSSQFVYCDGTEFYSALNVNSVIGDLSVVGNETVGGTFAVNAPITFSGNLSSTSNSLSFTSYTGIIDASPSTGALVPPTGTTAQRPSSLALGTARWNTTLGWYEIWSGAQWVSVTGSYSASYLIVAGGGGGGGGTNAQAGGGGGGAGGAYANSTTVTSGTSYSITVGSGGGGGIGASTSGGGNGSNSVAFSHTMVGGGGGACNSSAGYANGNNGGSGGGGYGYTAGSGAGGSGTSGQGNNGAATPGGDYGGGGGGFISAGSGASGGAGLASSITGTSVNYAVGGNGGAGGNGTPYTGNGGNGGVSPGSGNGGSGGSGVVIISYQASYQRATGGTVTSYVSGGNSYYVHTFTTSGTFIA